jgi:hypothetical protein
LSGDQTIYGAALSSSTSDFNFPSSTVNLYTSGHYYSLGSCTIPSGYYIDSISVNSGVSGNGDASAVQIKKSGSSLTFGYIPNSNNQQVLKNRFKIVFRSFYVATT